jgi:hypothetical protein
MNDLPFQKVVTAWMTSEAYTRFRAEATGENPAALPLDDVTETRPRPQIVQPRPEERYVTCVPLVPLKGAAGAFGSPSTSKTITRGGRPSICSTVCVRAC